VPAAPAAGAERPGAVPRGRRREDRPLRALDHDKLRFGLVKLMTDGSIQGMSGRLKWPGYMGGRPNGIWNIEPEALKEVLHAYHAAGLQCHIHTNGDEASEVAIEAVEAALARYPALGPPPHPAALPDGGRGAVPPHGQPGHLRQPLRQPHLVLGRAARRHDHGPRTRRAAWTPAPRPCARACAWPCIPTRR
jgi:hypothetical protein